MILRSLLHLLHLDRPNEAHRIKNQITSSQIRTQHALAQTTKYLHEATERIAKSTGRAE